VAHQDRRTKGRTPWLDFSDGLALRPQREAGYSKFPEKKHLLVSGDPPPSTRPPSLLTSAQLNSPIREAPQGRTLFRFCEDPI
jgi:hypothetical protein